MATGLNAVSVTGSSAGCCLLRRRFCGRFRCCGAGDWLPSPAAARGLGELASGAALPSSLFFSLPLSPSSGVAAATSRRERREVKGGATRERRAIPRAPDDDAEDEAEAPATERGGRACCIVVSVRASVCVSAQEERDQREGGAREREFALAAASHSLGKRKKNECYVCCLSRLAFTEKKFSTSSSWPTFTSSLCEPLLNRGESTEEDL